MNYKDMVGGRNVWNEMSAWQFDLMVNAGLKPRHLMLDIGCGSLRGGRKFAKYLEPNHYYGTDKNEELFMEGLENELEDIPVTFQRDEYFIIPFNRKFDYVLAQSVFTHVPFSMFKECLRNLQPKLKKDGKFIFTFFDKNRPPSWIDVTSYTDPFCYKLGDIELAIAGNYEMEEIEKQHPRQQKTIMLTKK